MNLTKLSFSFAESEVTTAFQALIAQSAAKGGSVPPGMSDLKISFKKGKLEIATKQKMGFMPVTISGLLGLRPTADGQGIVIAIEKISAGFISSQAVTAKIMEEVRRSLEGVPGCAVSEQGIKFTKEALAAKFPWFNIPGKVNRFDIEGDTLYVDIG